MATRPRSTAPAATVRVVFHDQSSSNRLAQHARSRNRHRNRGGLTHRLRTRSTTRDDNAVTAHPAPGQPLPQLLRACRIGIEIQARDLFDSLNWL